jgi:hypothetical protein
MAVLRRCLTKIKVRVAVAIRNKKQVNAPGTRAARFTKNEADRAMTWRKKAVAAGYNDVAQMKTVKDLETLHDRADFEELLAALGAKQKKEK